MELLSLSMKLLLNAWLMEMQKYTRASSIPWEQAKQGKGDIW